MRRKNIKQIIKEYFLSNPTTKLRVRQIERYLNLPLPSVIRYCKELEKEGILKRNKAMGVVFYTADRTNKSFILEKRIFNIKQLYSSGLVDFIKRELSNPVIIVFGSYCRGEDIETSDIDLYIETVSKKKIELKEFERKTRRKIHVFLHKNIKEIKNPRLANNIINGIVLNGFIEVFK